MTRSPQDLVGEAIWLWYLGEKDERVKIVLKVIMSLISEISKITDLEEDANYVEYSRRKRS